MQGKPKDAAQVLAVVKFLAALDQRGTLESLFRGDIALSKTEKTVVEREEAWILGVSGAFEK